MKIDRALQNEILVALGNLYPGGIVEVNKTLGLAEDEATTEKMLANLVYLEEHELIESGYKVGTYSSGETYWSNNGRTRITAAGLDFIADDGGLGAILKTVTVRLDASQFAELLASKVENLPGVPAQERSELAKAIRKMPATAIEKLTEKMIDWTVDHAGEMLPLVRAAVAMAG